MSKNILITGSAGFIGSQLIDYLFNNSSFNIYGIDNLSSYYDPKLKLDRNKFNSHKYQFIKMDLLNLKKLDEVFNYIKIDIIIHLAAQPGVRYSFKDPNSYLKNNINASYNLFEIAKKHKVSHILLASTSSTYGVVKIRKSFNEKFDSDHPVSLYAATKKSVEVLAHNYSHNFKLPITVFRFFTVYGPWGRPDMALFKFLNAMIKNKNIDVYGNGELFRDYTFIDDLTESISKLISKPPNKRKLYKNDNKISNTPYRIVNIGNQNAIKLNDFIKTLEKVTGIKAKKKYLPIQQGDVPFTLSDTKLLYEMIKFKPNTPIAEGIYRFYNWYKDYYKLK